MRDMKLAVLQNVQRLCYAKCRWHYLQQEKAGHQMILVVQSAKISISKALGFSRCSKASVAMSMEDHSDLQEGGSVRSIPHAFLSCRQQQDAPLTDQTDSQRPTPRAYKA